MRFTPTDDWVQLDVDIKIKERGLYMPDGTRAQIKGTNYHKLATVVAVGPGRMNDEGKMLPPPPFKKGDRVVLYRLYEDNVIEIGSLKIIVVDPNQIFARVYEESEADRADTTDTPAGNAG